MACNQKCSSWFNFFCFFLLIGLASSSSISYDVLEAHGHSGRALLQAKKPCNMSFENLDYSILTSKCKGPLYPAEQCCGAFKEFSCPYRDAINDLETDCASTMFSYINLYGKYPPGLFANECREGKNGLDCEQVDKAQDEAQTSSARHISITQQSSLLITVLMAGILVLLSH